MPNNPRGPASLVTEEHFRLLQAFGKRSKGLPEDHKKQLWGLGCEGARIPFVPHEIVVEVWKQYLGGTSQNSSIAVNGDASPGHVTVGICFKGKLTASHTTRVSSILGHLLRIRAEHCGSREEFLETTQILAEKIALKVFRS